MTRPQTQAAAQAQPPAPRARYDGLAAWYDGVMTDPGDRRGLATIAFGIVADLLGPGGGRYVPVCLHPCFDGNYAEKRPDGTVV